MKKQVGLFILLPLIFPAYVLANTSIEDDVLDEFSTVVAGINDIEVKLNTIQQEVVAYNETQAVNLQQLESLESSLVLNEAQLKQHKDLFVQVITSVENPLETKEYQALSELALRSESLKQQITELKQLTTDESKKRELLALEKATKYDLSASINAFKDKHSTFLYNYSKQAKRAVINSVYSCNTRSALSDCVNSDGFKQDIAKQILNREFVSDYYHFGGVELKDLSYTLSNASQNLQGELVYTAKVEYKFLVNPGLLRATKDMLGIDFEEYQVSLKSNCNATYEVNRSRVGSGTNLAINLSRGSNTIIASCDGERQSVVREIEQDQALYFNFAMTKPEKAASPDIKPQKKVPPIKREKKLYQPHIIGTDSNAKLVFALPAAADTQTLANLSYSNAQQACITIKGTLPEEKLLFDNLDYITQDEIANKPFWLAGGDHFRLSDNDFIVSGSKSDAHNNVICTIAL